MADPVSISDVPGMGFVDASYAQKHTSILLIPPESILPYRIPPSGPWHAASLLFSPSSRKQANTWFCEMVHPHSPPALP